MITNISVVKNKKFSMKNLFRRFLRGNKKVSLPILILIFSVILLNTYIVLGMYNQKKLSNETFRLHVVANSNSTEDQITKLKISTKVQNYLSNILKNTDTKQEAMDKINSNMDSILEISNNELKNDNKEYLAYAKLGNMHYDKKIDQNLTMPEGNYDSLQIVLGEGQGKNFWSLIFPNENNIKNLEGLESILPGISEIYGDEDTANISNSDESDNVVYSFKILEIYDSLKNMFK